MKQKIKKERLSQADKVATERLPTNNEQAEEYGHPAGLLFFLGLNTRLNGQNGLGGWGCHGCWLDIRCCRVEGLIAVVISVIGLAITGTVRSKGSWCEVFNQFIDRLIDR